MKILTSTNNLTHEQWLEYRRKGIGGSDAGAIAGLNPWSSPIQVYRDKIGEGEPVKENEAMRIGKDLEDYVAQRFAEETGYKVRRKNAILQHDELEWMLANIDREIVGVKEGLECKVTNSYAASDWEKGIPPMYEIQCHHYMAVTGWSVWWIAALVGNSKLVIKKIERDEEIIDYLIQLEKEFWDNHVMVKVMPPPDGSDSAAEMIKQLYPTSSPEKAIGLPTFEPHVLRIKEIDQVMKELKDEQEKLKQEIQVEMEDAEVAEIGEYKVKWSTVVSGRLDSKTLKKDHPEIAEQYTKESVSRRFTIK